MLRTGTSISTVVTQIEVLLAFKDIIGLCWCIRFFTAVTLLRGGVERERGGGGRGRGRGRRGVEEREGEGRREGIQDHDSNKKYWLVSHHVPRNVWLGLQGFCIVQVFYSIILVSCLFECHLCCRLVATIKL